MHDLFLHRCFSFCAKFDVCHSIYLIRIDPCQKHFTWNATLYNVIREIIINKKIMSCVPYLASQRKTIFAILWVNKRPDKSPFSFFCLLMDDISPLQPVRSSITASYRLFPLQSASNGKKKAATLFKTTSRLPQLSVQTRRREREREGWKKTISSFQHKKIWSYWQPTHSRVCVFPVNDHWRSQPLNF